MDSSFVTHELLTGIDYANDVIAKPAEAVRLIVQQHQEVDQFIDDRSVPVAWLLATLTETKNLGSVVRGKKLVVDPAYSPELVLWVNTLTREGDYIIIYPDGVTQYWKLTSITDEQLIDDDCPTCGADGGTGCGLPNCGLLQNPYNDS